MFSDSHTLSLSVSLSLSLSLSVFPHSLPCVRVCIALRALNAIDARLRLLNALMLILALTYRPCRTDMQQHRAYYDVVNRNPLDADEAAVEKPMTPSEKAMSAAMSVSDEADRAHDSHFVYFFLVIMSYGAWILTIVFIVIVRVCFARSIIKVLWVAACCAIVHRITEMQN
jgi:hypothetical protein